MLVLYGLCYLWMVSLFFALSRSRIRALIEAAVAQTALAVLIAELTSLFTAYNLLWVSLCWGVCLLAAMALHRRYLKTLLPCKSFFQHLPTLARGEKLLLLLMAGTVAWVVFKIFLSPPNAPSDSIVYHQPRAFMYYKDQSIHAFAASYGHMLYFGPLNAILMAQMQILCFGWDGLYQFVQFAAYILTMLAIFQTARLFCRDRRFALIGAALVCFMPMAHLQASTTQSDLLVTCFCAVAAYFMLQIWTDLNNGEKPSWRLYILLGLSCGQAVLSKLNAGVTLVFFSLLFGVALFVKLRRRAFLRLGTIVLCVLCMTGGFWTRNALDWNGDFLPLSYAGARPVYQAIGVKGTLLISAKALATTLASPNRELPAVLALPSYWAAKAAAALLNMDLDAPGTNEDALGHFTGTVHLMPDDISYPLHSVAVAAALLYFLIVAIRKKKGWLLAYTLCCVLSILFTSTQYVWVSSFNRYLCPPFVLCFPLVVRMLQLLCSRNPNWRRVCAVWLGCMFAFNACCSVVHPVKDILDYKALNLTYPERLIRGMDPSAIPFWREVNADITQNGHLKIGFDSRVGNGDYFWMRAFAPPAYDVHYINATVRPDLEDANFVPDCIIASFAKNQATETLEYHGARYVRKFPVTCIFWPQDYALFVTAYYVKQP